MNKDERKELIEGLKKEHNDLCIKTATLGSHIQQEGLGETYLIYSELEHRIMQLLCYTREKRISSLIGENGDILMDDGRPNPYFGDPEKPVSLSFNDATDSTPEPTPAEIESYLAHLSHDHIKPVDNPGILNNTAYLNVNKPAVEPTYLGDVVEPEYLNNEYKNPILTSPKAELHRFMPGLALAVDEDELDELISEAMENGFSREELYDMIQVKIHERNDK